MDTKTLISDTKARFRHNASKEQLKDKYDSKLIVAEQNGLWKADAQTIALLSTLVEDNVVLIDTFNNPVRVKRSVLLNRLVSVYNQAMNEWYDEWSGLETKR